MEPMTESRKQVVTGVTPPQLGEALIREIFPSVTAIPAAAALGQTLIKSIILAPLGWALLLPIYFKKVLPVVGTRYALTNRRLMIQRGLTRKVAQEVALADIDDVRIASGTENPFFRSATLEVLSRGQVVMTLIGVPDPESFRRAIINAVTAWVPERTGPLRFPASAIK
jgi:hypothetical protein